MKDMKHNRLGGLVVAATLTAMLLGGCQKDNTTLRIQIAPFDGGSKVTLDGYTAYWSNGDNVMINEVSETIASNGHTVSVNVPTAAIYKAIYPAEYASSDMAHLDIPQTQLYAVDAQGRQKVMAPMGAYSESSSLQFTPMCSLLEIAVANSTGRGALTVNKIVVKASSAALWGGATVHDLTNSNRSYTIDNPYSEGVNDSVILSGAEGASMGVSVAANSTQTFYVCIPAISPEVSNKFTITVYATDANGDNFCYTLSQQNAYSGNIPNGKLAEVPFALTPNNETELICTMYYTTTSGNLEDKMTSLASANGTSIREITQLPDGSYAAVFRAPITTIGDRAFYDCSGLTSVTIPNSVTSIGVGAFTFCSGLTSIDIPNSVTTIGENAFIECSSLTTITIGNSVTSIGDRAFSYCIGLTSITIPNSVTSIGEGVFFNCSSLTTITIGNSVTSIGGFAFVFCERLTDVTIPNSVTSIGESAFQGCSSLTSITIGNSVTSIGDYACQYCSSLTTVTIGNSVTSIGRFAFLDCSSLTSITIPSSVTSIGESAFYDCSNLASVTIPNSVTSIGDNAFNGCSSLTSIDIPNSVTAISMGTFNDCSGLIYVTIPNSVTAIGVEAFQGCSNLAHVTCLRNVPPSLGDDGFNRISTNAILHVPSGRQSYYNSWGSYFGGGILGDATL